jgi:hypothetical protein
MALTTFVSGQVLTAAQLNDSYAAVGGLRLVSSTTIGSAVSSVTVSNAFSATYDNYRIIISGGASTGGGDLLLKIGAATSGYKWQVIYGSYNNVASASGTTTGSSFTYAGALNTSSLSMDVTLLSPFLTEFTYCFNPVFNTDFGGVNIGYLNNTTSYTDFTITTSGGTITGGTIRVYGFANTN